jgi:DNA repair protein RadC
VVPFFFKERTMKHLSDADLLSVLIGENQANAILQDGIPGLLNALKSVVTNPTHVVRDSVGTYLAQGPMAKVAAAMEFATRCALLDISDRPALRSPTNVRAYLVMALGKLEYEVFHVLFLDAQHRLISSEELFRGTVNQTAVYPREVVKRALQLNAAALVVSHNHPSGIADPSNADMLLTEGLSTALKTLDIRLLDHIIVAGNTTLSFAEKGLI